MADDNIWKSYTSLYDGWTYWTPTPINEEKPLTKTCECGTNKALGYEAPSEFHSDWCPLKEKDDNSSKTS